jgi:hypothetical protein
MIFRKSHEEHLRHLKQVLDVLKKQFFFLNMYKYEFGKTSLVYFAHIFGGGELKNRSFQVQSHFRLAQAQQCNRG